MPETRRPAPSDDFAARLDRLWRSVYPKSQGRPYTYEEAAREITAAGHEVTGAYLQMLRTGRRTDPKMSYIEALAGFFGVPTAFFFDDDVADQISAQLDELARIRDMIGKVESAQNGPTQAIALRADGLSPKSLHAIATLIDQARQLEGLPPARAPKAKGGTKDD